MKIELRKLSEIKPYPGNPHINDQAVVAVRLDSRVRFPTADCRGYPRGNHLYGHTRYKAALQRGLDKATHE